MFVRSTFCFHVILFGQKSTAQHLRKLMCNNLHHCLYRSLLINVCIRIPSFHSLHFRIFYFYFDFVYFVVFLFSLHFLFAISISLDSLVKDESNRQWTKQKRIILGELQFTENGKMVQWSGAKQWKMDNDKVCTRKMENNVIFHYNKSVFCFIVHRSLCFYFIWVFYYLYY